MYSDIISAADYVQIMGQHMYMKEADQTVANTASYWARSSGKIPTVLDIGCGPGRVTQLLTSSAVPMLLTGIDTDAAFLEYAEQNTDNASFICADLTTYTHPEFVDIITSHGLDHHIAPSYLSNVYNYLKPGGVYIIGDEFLPHYEDGEGRAVKAVIWYAHVISTALLDGNTYLAEEEAKTLLDDLNYGNSLQIKTRHQIELLIDSVSAIHKAYESRQWSSGDYLARALLSELSKPAVRDARTTLAASRGDYKVCHAEFIKKVEQYGFAVVGLETIGPINTIGGFGVYTLQKPIF